MTPAIILSLLEILKKTNLTAIIIQVSASIDDSSKVFLPVSKGKFVKKNSQTESRLLSVCDLEL